VAVVDKDQELRIYVTAIDKIMNSRQLSRQLYQPLFMVDSNAPGFFDQLGTVSSKPL
jgi:hypothetical protein